MSHFGKPEPNDGLINVTLKVTRDRCSNCNFLGKKLQNQLRQSQHVSSSHSFDPQLSVHAKARRKQAMKALAWRFKVPFQECLTGTGMHFKRRV